MAGNPQQRSCGVEMALLRTKSEGRRLEFPKWTAIQWAFFQGSPEIRSRLRLQLAFVRTAAPSQSDPSFAVGILKAQNRLVCPILECNAVRVGDELTALCRPDGIHGVATAYRRGVDRHHKGSKL